MFLTYKARILSFLAS
uniref:Uncharacterized protein n=1 Tax=Rhizophora mucronata TaxID=61149 RepID=A0A2P2R3L7_RHIMU